MSTPDPAWRRIARTLKRTREQLLHPMRRAAALRTVAALQGPQRLLFVCLGNICRSPYAHQRAATLLASTAHTVRSGGFVGPGRRAPDEAQAAALERGIRLADHVSAPLPESLVRESTLIVVMDEPQSRRVRSMLGRDSAAVVLLGDFDPHSIETRIVRDPWKKPVEEFRHCYSRIDRCVEALVCALKPFDSR
jgi:protein-tyrosine phosphatase